MHEKLTPYQGERRTFGLYQCTKCDKEWASAHSWANTYQKCFKCNTKVYAHRQWKPKRKKRKSGEPIKKHLEKLCEKCQKLGYRCTYIEDQKSDVKKKENRSPKEVVKKEVKKTKSKKKQI